MPFTTIALKEMISSIQFGIFGIDPIPILATIAISLAISKETNKRIMTLFPTATLIGIIGFQIPTIIYIMFAILFGITLLTTEGFGGFETTTTKET